MQDGNTPARMTIAFVRRDAFMGDLNYNPFFFGMNFKREKAAGVGEMFHIKSINVLLRGTPMQPMASELDPYDLMHEFVRFNRVFNAEGYNECNNIGYNRFKVRPMYITPGS